MDFSYKNASIQALIQAYIHLLSRVKHFKALFWMDALYQTSIHCYYKARKSQNVFKYNSDWIYLKEENHIRYT